MKYIIEIAKEYEEYFKGILICGIADGKFAVDVIAREDLEELTSDYINEHFGSLQDDAYQRGLEDAWEAVRKIVHMPEGDLLNIFTECYSAVCTALQVLLKYDASEAIAKLKAYEEQKADDEIKVGDEVQNCHEPDVCFVVTSIDTLNEQISGFNRNGHTYSCRPKDNWRKTGRHFNIDKILEEMRE